MKKHVQFGRISLCALLALAMASTVASAQQSSATGTANASATVEAAISIAKTADLDFGAVVAGGALGTVVQTADAAPVRNSTGGTSLGSAAMVSPATFSVTGEPNATYAITLPSAPVTISSGANDMTVDTFTGAPNGTGTLGGGGAQTLYVGATLHVAANQAAGAYTGTFNVTVAYN